VEEGQGSVLYKVRWEFLATYDSVTTDQLFILLQKVGAELKTLMMSVDAEIVKLPVECHAEVSCCRILVSVFILHT